MQIGIPCFRVLPRELPSLKKSKYWQKAAQTPVSMIQASAIKIVEALLQEVKVHIAEKENESLIQKRGVYEIKYKILL